MLYSYLSFALHTASLHTAQLQQTRGAADGCETLGSAKLQTRNKE